MFDFPNAPIVGSTITAPNGTVFKWDGDKWIGASSTQAVASPYGNVGRNLIHNGLFNVAQRGAGPFAAGGYTLDRWTAGLGAGDTQSISQAQLSDGERAVIGDEAARFALQCVFTGAAGASNYVYMQHKIEDIRRLAGKAVTLSFYANAGTANIKLGINLGQIFGTGGAPSATISTAPQVVTLSSSAGTWTRSTLTFAMPSSSGKTFGTNNDSFTALNIWYSAGSGMVGSAGAIGVQSGTINIWGVQLEIGNVATPLEKPDPQVDLANCCRFYQVGVGRIATHVPAGGSGIGHSMLLPVRMRASPTMTSNFTTQTNCSSSTVGAITDATVHAITIATAAGGLVAEGAFTASADL
jgi:hypothetical protein